MQDYMTPNEVYRSAEYGKRLAERIKPMNDGRFEIAAAHATRRERQMTDWLWMQYCDRQRPCNIS